MLDRNPCGSSSGSGAGVAASLAVVAIGTETNGSIVCPPGQTGVVGHRQARQTATTSARLSIDLTLARYDLDAIVAPTNSPA